MAGQRKPAKEQRDDGLPERIHDLQVFNGWTQLGFIEALYVGARREGVDYEGHGYSRSTIWRWENGITPSQGALRLIWAVSGVSWKWLTLGEGAIDATDGADRPE